MKKVIAAPFAVILLGLMLAMYLLHDPNKVTAPKQPGLLKRAWLRFDRLPFMYQLFLFLLVTVNLYIVLFVK